MGGLRVLMATEGLGVAFGGPAVSVPELARALALSGIEIGLWAAANREPQRQGRLECERLTLLSGTLESALDAYPDIDVIHDNGLWRRHNHVLATLARKRGIPRIVSTRGMLQPWARKNKALKKRIAWELYQKSDLEHATVLHGTSEDESAELARLNLGPEIVTIPNGVEIPDLGSPAWGDAPRRDKPNAHRQALFLSRLHPMKGLPLLIDAWARVRPAGWILAIAGPDEDGHRQHVERMIHDYGLETVVTFLGPLDKRGKLEAFRDSEFFVLPSYAESFGMVIAEAFAAELPVLTTNRTPWGHIVSAGCGWIADVTETSMAETLSIVTSLDRDTLIMMGQKGRALVSETH